VFVPKSIVCLREGYTREEVMRDSVAVAVVGIVALALAFAIASGVPPKRGLYTVIIAGFLDSRSCAHRRLEAALARRGHEARLALHQEAQPAGSGEQADDPRR
jgi:hypothetical protein